MSIPIRFRRRCAAARWWITACGTILIAGCGGTERVNVRAGESDRSRPPAKTAQKPATKTPAKSAPVDASLDSLAASPEAARLAEQSQRDVEAILQAKSNLSQNAHDSASQDSPTSAAVQKSAASHTAKPIVWNDAKAPTGTGSDPAHDAPESPRQSPLFMPLDDRLSETDKTGSAASQPSITGSLEPDRLQKLMVDLSRELYASGAYSDMPLKQLMVIAAMGMIDPKRSLDPQAIPDLTEKEQELLGKLQTFFAEIGRTLDAKADVEQSVVSAVNKLRDSLVKQPDLKLAATALCTRVGGFGDYTPFDKQSFLAGNEQKVIVYLEVDEFTSELNQKGEYVTELSQQLTIYSDRDGIPVWKEDWQSAVDVTKNKRQDFFTVQIIALPKALSVGKYQLKIRMRDEKSGGETESSIAFEMVADPKMAASLR